MESEERVETKEINNNKPTIAEIMANGFSYDPDTLELQATHNKTYQQRLKNISIIEEVYHEIKVDENKSRKDYWLDRSI